MKRAERLTQRLLTWLAFFVTLDVARSAWAQRAEIAANVDTDVVEVGETLTFSQQVTAHDGLAPSDPKPGPHPGFSMLGVASAPMRMHTNMNGVVDDVNGLTTSWTLRADKVGTFTLGPTEVVLNGSRRTGASVRVRVTPRGKGPPRSRGSNASPGANPFGANPLDPFKGLFNFGDDDPRERQVEPAAPNADPKLAMDAPRAPVAFLHATLDKTRAVVGEQVTLTVYLYEDPYARQGRPGDVHEATANEFVKRSLLEDETRAVGAGIANVGGKLWTVKLVRKNALFPLKTGRLAIEPMSLTLLQERVGLRASETLFVDVAEPPVTGRPPGYAVGDVGELSLQATVAPRAIARDGALGVTLELRGTGNLPGSLTLPTTAGVEWLEPQVRDKLGPLANDRFGGTRTFSYVVRVHKEGAVDLGEIRLPYFDPAKNAYAIARASLGVVNVAVGAPRDAGAGVGEGEAILAGLPKERSALEKPQPTSYLSERPVYWVALFGSPLGCAFVLGAHGLLGRYRERRAVASPSLASLAKKRRAEAEAACASHDGKLAMGAVARAIEAEVLARTGVNLRGARFETVKGELEAAVGEGETCDGLMEILGACEDARFSPDGVTIDVARTTWARACKVLSALSAIDGARSEGA